MQVGVCRCLFMYALVHGVNLKFDTDALCGFVPIAARRVINCVSEVVVWTGRGHRGCLPTEYFSG